MSEDDDTIGKCIRFYRERDNLTQAQLGDKIGGVSVGQISRWENGLQFPSKTNVRRLATAFDVHVHLLTSGGEITTIKRSTAKYDGGIARHLHRLGVSRSPIFQEAGLFSKNETRLCIDNVISLHSLNGIEGLSGNEIRVHELKTPPKLPQCVLDKIGGVAVSGADRLKVFLTKATLPPVDEDEGITIEVASAKYSVRRAMQDAREELQDDLIGQKIRLSDDPVYDELGELPTLLPCALNCDGVVIAGDKVLLTQRGKLVNVGAMEWVVSLGEGMEWRQDRDSSGRLAPLRTIWRGLEEELGVSEEWIKSEYGGSTSVQFLGLAFDLSTMLFLLTTVIEFPQLPADRAMERARSHAKEFHREIQDYATMEFTPEACAAAIVTGVVNDRKLVNSARFHLLLTCLHKFPMAFEEALAAYE